MANQLPPPVSPEWARPYKSAKPWAIVVTVWLSLTIAYQVIEILAFQGSLDFLIDMGLADAFNALVRPVAIALVIADAAAFLFWFWHAYRNLPALGAQELKWSPRSAVIWWFVPVANLFQPVQITAEIWKGSDPSLGSNTRAGRQARDFPPMLIAWWVLWLGSPIASRIRSSSVGSGTYALLTLPSMITAALALTVIWSIQLSQDRREL